MNLEIERSDLAGILRLTNDFKYRCKMGGKMQKRKFIGLLTLVVFTAIVFLFTGSKAMAICSGAEEDLLELKTSTGFTNSTYKVSLLKKNIWDGTGPTKKLIAYEWRYIIDSNLSANSEYDILVPACSNQCTDSLNYSLVQNGYYDDNVVTPNANSSAKIMDPGVGTAYLGMNDLHFQTIRVTSSQKSPQNAIYFYTPPTDSVATSLLVKSGNSFYVSKNIAGPACPRPGDLPNNLETRYISNGEYIKFVKDPGSECSGKNYRCSDASYDPSGCSEIEPGKMVIKLEVSETCTAGEVGCDAPPTYQVVDNCGDALGNQVCRECVIYHRGSTCYTRVSPSGGAYKVCYY